MIRIYLDNCCYGRPYDKPSNIRIVLESQAKMEIQTLIVEKRVELAASTYLMFENTRREDEAVRNHISDYITNNAEYYLDDPENEEVQKLHEEIMKAGIKTMDAFHIASAIALGCDCFITTDDRILKYKDKRIRIMGPVQFIIGEE